MPANVPESRHEERLADAVKRAWLNPYRTRVLSDLLGDHRTNYRLLHAQVRHDLALNDQQSDRLLALLREYL